MGAHQPFLYENDNYSRSSRFPESTFDPKAITRQSWEPKPQKPKQDGPLINIGRHPDAHQVLPGRRRYKAMSDRAKSWIKAMRVVQLCMRVLQTLGAIGILVLMILITNVEMLTSWVMRITAGVVVVHCCYSIYHLSAPAGRRTPASSCAYQLFSAMADLCVLPLYTYGGLSVRNSGSTWTTLLADQSLAQQFLVPGFYYGLIGAGGLHLLTLVIACWLGIKFRQITMMPPDMNPLESHLTSRTSLRTGGPRHHKRNKSSIQTNSTSSLTLAEKRMSDNSRRSYYDNTSDGDLSSRPPSVPFMHTRTGSSPTSLKSRDSRIDLPSRNYQIPHNASPRSSASNLSDLAMKRMSAPPLSSRLAPNRGTYDSIPLSDPRPSPRHSAHSTGTVPSGTPIMTQNSPATPRSAKFTEAWYASESLVTRTQERNRALNTLVANATGKRGAYTSVSAPRREDDVSSESEPDSDDENAHRPYDAPSAVSSISAAGGRGAYLASDPHPNPLRANPPRPKTPYRASRPSDALSEVSANERRVSGDIADTSVYNRSTPAPLTPTKGRSLVGEASKRNTWASAPSPARMRESSIQPEGAFYSKPYGELKCATPPVMVGGEGRDGRTGRVKDMARQISSGNDYYDVGGKGAWSRRNVSGKIAEEGRSRYSVLNDD